MEKKNPPKKQCVFVVAKQQSCYWKMCLRNEIVSEKLYDDI